MPLFVRIKLLESIYFGCHKIVTNCHSQNIGLDWIMVVEKKCGRRWGEANNMPLNGYIVVKCINFDKLIKDRVDSPSLSTKCGNISLFMRFFNDFPYF